MESYENVNTDPETVTKWMNQAIELLQICFKIEKLSINEKFIIRKITEQTLPIYNNSQGTIDSGFPIDREIAQRFLNEAYGIDTDYMNKYTENEKDEEIFIEYIRRVREKAHLI